MEIREMSIDLETYSDIDITKCGAYKYAESDYFEILLFGVSVNGGPVKVYDLAWGDTIPEEILGFQRFLRAYLPLQLAEAPLPGTLPRIQHP